MDAALFGMLHRPWGRLTVSGGKPRRQQTGPARGGAIIAVLGVCLIGAVALDYVALWPYVMTPFYAVPVLIAAHRLSPRGVAAVALVATVVDIISGLVQQTPLEVHLLYVVGLLFIDYLGVALAYQRQQVNQYAQEAIEADRRLQEFMRCVVHEFGNGLTALHGYLGLVQRRAGREASGYDAHAVEVMEHTIARLTRLIRDLRDAVRLGAGGFAIRPVPMDLAAVVREVVDLRHSTTDLHDVVVEAPPRLAGVWDPDRCAQLLSNLISNAIKYSPHGGTVRVAVASAEREVVMSVADQGLGMTAEQQAHLFQPFVRLHGEEAAEGVGLGLWITKGIVEAHGGRIWLESAPGAGTTFFVALPRATPPGATD